MTVGGAVTAGGAVVAWRRGPSLGGAAGGGLWGEAGFGLVDAMVGLTLLAYITTSLTGIFLSGITQAKTSNVHAEAAAWAEEELDYLRWLGYTSACLAAGTRTVTQTSTPCTALDPPLPTDFAQAVVTVEDNALSQTGLKRLTLEMDQVAGTVFYRVVTYVTQFQ